MKPLRFKRAKGIHRRVMKWAGIVAIVMPWGCCYYRGPLHEPLRRHEEAHWLQYQRHGRWLFPLLYLIESIRHGYQQNRFEIEARQAEHGTE